MERESISSSMAPTGCSSLRTLPSGVSFSLHTLLASQSTDGVPQLLLHPPINSVQNYTILDRVVVEQYPSRSSMLYTGDSESTNSTSYHPSIRPIYPAKWHSDPIFASVPHLPSKLEVSLVHATWKPGTKRFPGVSDHYDPQGSFVQGNWPDQISDLTFLPLLKNAHTNFRMPWEICGNAWEIAQSKFTKKQSCSVKRK